MTPNTTSHWSRWDLARNPFLPQPPREAEIRRLVFTGRTSESARILECAGAAEPCCIYGTYGMGKSMLMLHSFQIITEMGHGLVPVYQRYLAGQSFDDALLDGVTRELAKRGVSASLAAGPPMLSLRKLLDVARSRGLRVFAFVDDTDRTQELTDIKTVIDSIRELRDLACGVCVPGNPNNVTHHFGTRAQGILDVIPIQPFSADGYLDMAARYLRSARASAEIRSLAGKVFLSYARPDTALVSDLYKKLADLGFEPWMDEKNLYGGERWSLTIEQAIRECDFFVLCVSENSRDRRGVLQEEISQALEMARRQLDEDIYLIPVRLERCEPPKKIEGYHYIDLFQEDGLVRLEMSLRKGMAQRQGSPGEPDLPGSRALEPFDEGALLWIIKKVGVDSLTPRSFNIACRILLELVAVKKADRISCDFVESNWEHVGGEILASEGDIERVIRVVRELARHNGILDEENLDLDALLTMLNSDVGGFEDLIESIGGLEDVLRIEQEGPTRRITLSPLIDMDFVRNVFLQQEVDDFRQEYRLLGPEGERGQENLVVARVWNPEGFLDPGSLK